MSESVARTLNFPTLGLPAFAQLGWTSVLVHTIYNDNHVEFAAAKDGLNFVGIYTSDQIMSDSTPAVTALYDRIVFGWVGMDSNINFGFSKNLSKFQTYTPTNQQSAAGLALATLNGEVFVAWTGMDSANSINVGKIDEGLWDFAVTLPESAAGTVSLTTVSNQLVLVWKGLDGRINLMQSSDGRTWLGKQTFDEFATGAPGAIGDAGGAVYIGWAGVDSNNSLNAAVAQLEGSDKLLNKSTYNNSSYDGVAFFEYNGRKYISWTGIDKNRSLNYQDITH